MHEEYCAIDLETTGVNPFRDAICEIGMVRFTLSGGSVTKSYSTLINPGRAMPREVTAVHGITDDMVADSPREEEVLDTVFDFIGNSPLVIQNPRFDLSFLQIAFKKTGRKLLPETVYDTVSLAKYIYPRLRNHKLETVCRYLKIELSFHRALDDAIGCMKIFVEGCRKLFGSQVCPEVLNEICGFSAQEHLLQKIDSFNPLAPQKKFLIEYRDRDGNSTVREILVHDIYKQGKKIVVYAWCYLRNENRYFNYERIRHIREAL